jgi:hypothetical protein
MSQKLDCYTSSIVPLLVTKIKKISGTKGRNMSHQMSIGLAAAISVLLALPSSAEDSHFGTLTVPGAPTGEGHTGGSTSLPTLVENTDRENNLCLGFGDPLPDYILVLEQDVPHLNIQLDSGGQDTTLLVKGPDRTFHCADDTELGVDAGMKGVNWQAGTYLIWVGTPEPEVKWHYTISVNSAND